MIISPLPLGHWQLRRLRGGGGADKTMATIVASQNTPEHQFIRIHSLEFRANTTIAASQNTPET